MAEKSKQPSELQKAAQKAVDAIDRRRVRKQRALLEFLLDDISDEQEEDPKNSAASTSRKKSGPLKTVDRNTKYSQSPEQLTVPSEKEKMEGGTYSPPEEYKVVKKPKPRSPTPSKSSTKSQK